MDIEFSWDPGRLQFDRIHAAIAASYWSPDIRRDLVERAAANSLCLGAYDRTSGEQAAYARVVSDRATYAYLCDVIVFFNYRGRGIGTALVETALAHPDLQTVRIFALGTRDAQGLYERFGFTHVDASRRMERKSPNHVWQEQSDGQ